MPFPPVFLPGSCIGIAQPLDGVTPPFWAASVAALPDRRTGVADVPPVDPGTAKLAVLRGRVCPAKLSVLWPNVFSSRDCQVAYLLDKSLQDLLTGCTLPPAIIPILLTADTPVVQRIETWPRFSPRDFRSPQSETFVGMLILRGYLQCLLI